MTGAFATAIIAVALLLALWSLVLLVVDRPPNSALIGAAFVLELMLVVFAVGGIVQMIGIEHDLARAEFVGYLLGCVAIVPLAVWWMKDEKSRGASGVLLVVFLVTAFLILRVQQVWAGTSA